MTCDIKIVRMDKTPNGRQLISLTNAYLISCVETIYECRSPEQLGEIVTGKDKWCDLSTPSTQKIITKVSSPFLHGWIRVDIILSPTNKIIESWYLLHTPLQKVNDLLDVTIEEKRILFSKTKVSVRSLLSLLNSLPATTLSININRMPECNHKILAILKPLADFPVETTTIPEKDKLICRMPEMETPIGVFSIYCEYNNNLHSLIPRFLPDKITPKSSIITVSDSFDALSLSCDIFNSFKKDIDSDSEEKTKDEMEVMNLSDFVSFLDNSKIQIKPVSASSIKEKYKLISGEVDMILSEWNVSG